MMRELEGRAALVEVEVEERRQEQDDREDGQGEDSPRYGHGYKQNSKERVRK
jgi:hypothetical protein